MIHVGPAHYTGTIQADGGLIADTLVEKTADVGVIVEEVLIKDGLVDGVKVSDHDARHRPGGADALAVLGFFNGTFLASFDAIVVSDGATVTMSVEKKGGGDLTMNFSDGQTVLDCTPAASIALTAGTDTSPQENFIYVLQSTKVLTKSTSDWPSAAHIRVAYFLVPTASLVNTGAAGNNFLYVNQNWNDEASDTASQGHLSHIAQKIRHSGSTWHSGTQGTATQDGNDLWVSVTEGEISQMHPHVFPVLNSDTDGAGDPILVVNDPDAAYAIVHSLNEITKHSDGSAIGVNKYVKFILAGVANKSGEPSPMLLTLPSGEYNSAANAAKDVDGHADLSLPAEFTLESTTGFLSAAFVCKHTATAMEIQQTIDLRGTRPQTTGLGGSTPGAGDVTAAAPLTDNAIVSGDGGAKGVQTNTPSIALATGVVSIPGIGDGGYTSYDLCVGNLSSYGMIQMGRAAIGRTSFKAGDIDLDGTVLCRNIDGPVTSEIEFLWAESTGGDARFALPKSGVGNATWNSRSMILAGPAPANTDFVKVTYWQDQGIFHNLACDTSGTGADLGVQNDLEVEGIIYVDDLQESTTDAGITAESVLLKDGLVDGRDVETDGTKLDGIEAGAEVNVVDSVFGRTGDVVAAADDYTWAEVDKTTSDLADLTTKAHESLTGVTADQHHTEDHAARHTDGSDDIRDATHILKGISRYDPADFDVAAGVITLDSRVVKEADVDDTPADGATTDPISSNWAFDHVDQSVKVAASPTFGGLTVNSQAVVDGTADEIQLLVQGHSTQTNDILQIQKSDTTILGRFTNKGQFVANQLSVGQTTSDTTIANAVTGGFVQTGTPTTLLRGLLFYVNKNGNETVSFTVTGCDMTVGGTSVVAAGKTGLFQGALFLAALGAVQTSATATIPVRGGTFRATPGAWKHTGGNFPLISAYFQNPTVPAGAPTSSFELGAHSDGDIQVADNKKIILEGSLTTKGETYMVYNTVNSHIEFWIDGVLEGYVDGTGFHSI